MTMPENSDNKFEPHSDEDLATILEAQLLAMRGLPARSVDAPPAAPESQSVWIDDLFDVPTQEMTATEIAAVRPEPVAGSAAMPVAVAVPTPLLVPAAEPMLVRTLAPMPLMFATAEMARLMTLPSVSTTGNVIVDPVVTDDVVTDDVVAEEVAVGPVTSEADVETTVESEAEEEVTTEKFPRRAVPTSDNHLQDLPVFVRKSFDDLISGS